MRFVTLLLFILGLFVFEARTEEIQGNVSDKLFPYQYDKFAYEIGEIEFKGNINFNEFELFNVIQSRPSNQGLIRGLLKLYYDEGLKNPSTPISIINSLKYNLKQFEAEIKLFKEKTVISDIESIKLFYSQNGFHFTTVTYSFQPDFLSKTNKLTFYIKEGLRYKFGEVKYLGLEGVSPEIKTKIDQIIANKENENFSERIIVEETRAIQSLLLNSGYYTAYLNSAKVQSDTVKLTDDVIINFIAGKRLRISKILFKDTILDQKPVTDGWKSAQLNFKVGDWFSAEEIQKSEKKLRNLTIFERINFYPKIVTDSINGVLDSSIAILIECSYLKQSQFGAGAFYNQTSYDGLWNLGGEADYSIKNFTGAADLIHPYANLSIKDFDKLLKDAINGKPRHTEWEYTVGLGYQQPVLWNLNNGQIGGQANLSYSLRSFNNLFLLNAWTLNFKAPITLFNNVTFNKGFIELQIDRQKPINFDESIHKLDTTISSIDSTKKLEALQLYSNLNDYDKIHTNIMSPTSIILSFTAIGDKRNNPFSPTNGYYLSWNIDFSGIALSKFGRFQFNALYFAPVSNVTTFASKIRLGYTYLGGYSGNNFIPIERQFFSGGANSVRGWEARRLRYTKLLPDSLNNYTFYQDFVGSATIIEGSIELRYKFARPDNISAGLAEKIEAMGFTAFFDFGNAYSWYTKNDKTSISTSDYFTKLAFAAGIGFRYETPIGPFRLDFALPIWGPIDGINYSSILGRRNIVSNDMKIHIGIGHAF